MKKEKLDEAKIKEYIGKTILVGITYLDHKGNVLEQMQWHGIIKTINMDGIKIKRQNSRKLFNLPPDIASIKKAAPGIYKLRTTGEEIENPDFLSIWTVHGKDPDEK